MLGLNSVLITPVIAYVTTRNPYIVLFGFVTVAGIIGTGIAQNITINPGESNVVYLDGAYYIKAEGQGIMNGILLVRTRYSLNILAKSSNAGYDKLVVEQNGAHDTTLTNTADVVQTITIKRL